jgi:hypothetical protein
MSRKHFTQFSPDEIGFATGFIRRQVLPNVNGSEHFYDRATEREFTLDDAKETLRTGTVIEVHNDRGDWRALVRGKNGYCTVVSLETNRILTVYFNAPDDNHDTLNHKLYHGGNAFDVVAVVKNLLSQRRKQ